MRKLWLLFGLVWMLVACRGETAASPSSSQAVPQSDTISCTAAYRSSVAVGIEQEESLTFTDADDEQSVDFTEMTFHAAYRTGAADNERSLRVWVTDASASLSTGAGITAVYHSTLFQLETGSGPQNQFVGGHGFTGLNYSYAPGSTAELQFWCEAGL